MQSEAKTVSTQRIIKRALVITSLIVVVIVTGVGTLKYLLGQWYLETENRNFQILREKSKLNCDDLPLHCAVRDKNLALLNAIQSNSSQIEATDGWGRTPLYFAAAYSDKEAVDILLNKRANPDVYDDRGSPVLFYSLEMKKYEIAKNLLEHGAQVDIEVKGESNTVSFYPLYIPLGFCVANNDLECVSLLLDYGADVDKKSAIRPSGENLSVYEMAMSNTNVNAKVRQLLKDRKNKIFPPVKEEQRMNNRG